MEALYKKLYNEIKKRYPSLENLTLRLQEDYNGIIPFKQDEQDRLDLCYILDLFDTIERKIRKQGDKKQLKDLFVLIVIQIM